jgi:tetratricopeptide (TPR) repeat protein
MKYPISRAILPLLLLTGAAHAAAPAQSGDPDYVGSTRCGDCHQAEYAAWKGSHHDLAMAAATPATVRGDFDDAQFTAHGITSRFYRKDGGYRVRTDGPDGKLTDYAIAYTFGWEPLQQYLIAFPDGRLQALGIAWDTRPAEQGGQRWFHLYPNETDLDYRHPLHWTGREQTWNYQCAECHTTNLRKGYDQANDSYATTWTEDDVGCETCHGPGAAHAAQAEAAAAGKADAWDDTKGMVADLIERDGGEWRVDPVSGLPARQPPRASAARLDVCARCHSRRGHIGVGSDPDAPLGDTHRLALLTEGLYHADGQILDEVFVHGSFLQSKMHRKGVICSDCHDAHTLKLKQPGDAVCGQCHMPARYDTPDHHHHPADAPSGNGCVDCHMPQRHYMIVDERADHSMRIPRPDLSAKLGTPNACNQCHADRTPEWAAAAVTDWYGEDAARRPSYAEALQAGRTGAADAGNLLSAVAGDPEQPGIVRATAIELLRGNPQPTLGMLMPRLAADPDPLVRAATARYLEDLSPDVAVRLGFDLLKDPVRMVRIDAVRALAPLIAREAQLPGRESPLRAALDPVLEEYREAQLTTAERPEAQMNLGMLASVLGDAAGAQRHYAAALTLDPAFVPGYVNLADLYRALERDQDGRAVLERGLAVAPENADLSHALGLLEVRAGNIQAAVAALGRAAELAPENPRYSFTRALAQQAAGDLDAAIATLTEARERHPNDREIGFGLVTLTAESGDLEGARALAAVLARRFPADPQARALLQQLEQMR